MNIEDILKGPQRRTKTVSIEGLQDFVMTELTAAERWQIEAGQDVKFYARWVLYSLLGCKRNPTDGEVDQFCQTYGHDVIDTQIEALLNFNAIDKNAVDAAKKN